MWWTLATALANPTETSLAMALDHLAPPRDRVRATRSLGRLEPSDPAVPGVVTPLAASLDSELPPPLAPAIRKTLGRLDATAVWTEQLGAKDPDTRAVAAGLLGREGQTSAGPALVDALGDPSAKVRAAAAGALASYPNAQAIDDLETRLRDSSVRVRLAAAQTLGFLGGEEAQKALVNARLSEKNEVVRHYLEAAIGHIARRDAGLE